MKLRLAAFTIVASVMVASCATGPDVVALSSSDAKLLFQELNLVFLRAHLDRVGTGLSITATSAHGPAGIDLNQQAFITGSINCAGGGTITLTGDDNTTGGQEAFDLTLTFRACFTDHFQLDGPYRQVVASADSASITTTGTGDLNVSVRADGRSGSCHLDFTYTVTGTGITATGTICGLDAAGSLL